MYTILYMTEIILLYLLCLNVVYVKLTEWQNNKMAEQLQQNGKTTE